MLVIWYVWDEPRRQLKTCRVVLPAVLRCSTLSKSPRTCLCVQFIPQYNGRPKVRPYSIITSIRTVPAKVRCCSVLFAASVKTYLNPLNANLNPICHLLALLVGHHILHVSSIRVKQRRQQIWLYGISW